MGNVKILADSTCDLSPELVERYNIGIIPLNIVLDGKSYLDGVEITPDEIYAWANANAQTPKTAAPNFEAAVEFLRPYKEAGDDAVCFTISTEMSSANHVLKLAAEELDYADHIAVIDSRNLSTGIGLQVIKAAEFSQKGMPLCEIAETINTCRDRVRASFVVDTLTYLYRGGRCTAVAALFGNALKLKPRIAVESGKMGVSRKYRGDQSKVVLQYAKDMEAALLNAEPEHVFITHSGISDETEKLVREYLESLNYFKEIHTTRAGGVVSSHCGWGTLGVLFYEK